MVRVCRSVLRKVGVCAHDGSVKVGRQSNGGEGITSATLCNIKQERAQAGRVVGAKEAIDCTNLRRAVTVSRTPIPAWTRCTVTSSLSFPAHAEGLQYVPHKEDTMSSSPSRRTNYSPRVVLFPQLLVPLCRLCQLVGNFLWLL